MNNYEQAQKILEKGDYASFFELMRELNAYNAEFRQLDSEYIQGLRGVDFNNRVLACLNRTFDAQTGKKKATYLTPFYPSGKFIGREKELHDLHTYLLQNLPTVVVNGIGGIGKTSLAKQYMICHGHHYDHIFWCE